VDKLVVASRALEGEAPFLVGAIFDVRRGSMLREGSVRTVAGGVPSANIGALAAFLLTGAQQREVRGRSSEIAIAPAPGPDAEVATASIAMQGPMRSPATPDLRPPPPRATALLAPMTLTGGARGQGTEGARRSWRRPGAWVAGGLALGLAGLSAQQRLAANDAYDRADALLGPGGVPSSTELGRFQTLTADGSAAARNSWISLGVSAAFAVASGYLGWSSSRVPPAPAAF
jgi:hypothetical protein